MRLIGALLLVGASTIVPAAAAQAADPLELSLDGTSWSATLPGMLFASPSVVVPGDVISSALWVRNATGDPARVDLEVADDLGVTPGTLAGDLSLSIDGTPAPGGTSWHGPDLAPGGTARIPLVVTFAASSPLTSQVSVAAVLDAVTLVQTGIGPGVAPTTPATAPAGAANAAPPASGGLAHTGAEIARAAGISLGAIVVGFLLLAARRRSRRAEN
ncbi:hypothetical protein [Cellulomonas sp. P5_C6]